MDTAAINAALKTLIEERSRIEEAIIVLERLLREAAPDEHPAGMPSRTQPRKRQLSAAARRKMAAAQRRRWAAVRAAQANAKKPAQKKRPQSAAAKKTGASAATA